MPHADIAPNQFKIALKSVFIPCYHPTPVGRIVRMN